MWQEFLPATEQPVTDAIGGCSRNLCHLVAAKYSTGGNGRLQDVLRAPSGSLSMRTHGRIIIISVGAAAKDSKAKHD